MSPFDTALTQKLLQRLLPWLDRSAWRIAFSGGLDSTVLLHLLAQLKQRHRLPPLTAIHVHHGLQAAADAWPEHCRAQCEALAVPLQVVAVQVQPGASLERAAREARYAVFEEITGSNELLLTAQHRDDQAETLLFRLLRGAGIRGLSAMPASRALGLGHLLRPLLDVSRDELERYARDHQLRWIDDPSNQDRQFSRNYLRHQVFPLLTARWPQAASSMARSAAHLREARELLDELAIIDLQEAAKGAEFEWLGLPSLALAPLLGLSQARQRNALSHWLSRFTPLPDSDHWAGWQTLRDAAGDSRPVWRLGQGEVQRAAGRVWWLSDSWLRPELSAPSWVDTAAPLPLPGNGRLQFIGSAPQGPLQVRYRQGGEVMQLPGRGHRDLKRLLNEAGLPAFVRGRLPLLYRGEQLLAVANLPGLDANAHEGWQLHWQPPSSDQGLS
ncbi:tRNA lysidine(34) synthetase TilS [Pseudomonas chlororaphis]|uniref:tRNA lysidine(34) synthetase TilS n=1 Tax=Pseudomonas chlororaphis TaxID=587753 RepID=UPI000F4AAECF|nr:tRNA lysidine(34) synthetase TilS [Pseudomonas chlororaphis]ROL85358.1 tRNA lysidine(34) synthetase TilS [Pseudomonas chlororaphis]